MKNSADDIINLKNRVKEIAVKIAPDYPNVEMTTTWDQLYAIETAYEGISLANDDMHYILKTLMERYNIEEEEVLAIDTANKII